MRPNFDIAYREDIWGWNPGPEMSSWGARALSLLKAGSNKNVSVLIFNLIKFPQTLHNATNSFMQHRS